MKALKLSNEIIEEIKNQKKQIELNKYSNIPKYLDSISQHKKPESLQRHGIVEQLLLLVFN